jgi:hypothetical protein
VVWNARLACEAWTVAQECGVSKAIGFLPQRIFSRSLAFLKRKILFVPAETHDIVEYPKHPYLVSCDGRKKLRYSVKGFSSCTGKWPFMTVALLCILRRRTKRIQIS